MKCSQCASQSGKGVQSLAACPCSVPVGGMKDGGIDVPRNNQHACAFN